MVERESNEPVQEGKLKFLPTLFIPETERSAEEIRRDQHQEWDMTPVLAVLSSSSVCLSNSSSSLSPFV